MFSEVLTSLAEVKAKLETDLLQQPEYRALLIFEKAAAQLSGAFAGRAEPGRAEPEADANACVRVADALARPQPVVDVALLEECVRRALADVGDATEGTDEAEGAEEAASPLACEADPATQSGETAEVYEYPAEGPAVERAIEGGPAPSPRFFLPFVGAPHRIEFGRY